MRSLRTAALVFVLAVAGATGASAADAPRRIVCFIPAVTQMLFAIGAGPQVVAVGTYDHDPPEVARLPRVGGLLDPDIERILGLRPDLVVVYDGQRELISRLATARIGMFHYRHSDLAGVIGTIRELGRAVGHQREGDALASGIEARLQAVAGRVAGRPRPLTLLLFGREPRALTHLDASGGYGFLHDMLVAAGGRDLFADVKRESVQPSLELILARRPEVIIELHYGAGASVTDRMEPWRKLGSIPAVRTGRLYEITGDDLVEPGPRVAEATEKLSRVLHPEAWRFN